MKSLFANFAKFVRNNKNVIWLDVRVDEPQRVHVRERGSDIREYASNLVTLDTTAGTRTYLDVFLAVKTVIFENKSKIQGSRDQRIQAEINEKDVANSDDVRVVTKHIEENTFFMRVRILGPRTSSGS